MNSEFEPEDLSSLFDEELTPSENERLRQRVERAPAQQALLEEFAQIRSLLRELPQEAAPAGLAESIRSQIASEHRPSAAAESRLPMRRWRWIVSGLTACGLLVIGMVYYPLLNSTSEQATSDMLVAEADPSVNFEMSGDADFLARQAPRLKPHAANDLNAFSLESMDDVASPEIASTMAADSPHPTAAPFLRSAPGEVPAAAAGAATPRGSMPHDRDAFGAAITAMPAAPPLSENTETQIARLAASPKWRNKFRPGELVQYITVEEGEVAVVELSVVDVAHFYGEMQVLLAGQQIRPLQKAIVADSELEAEAVATSGRPQADQYSTEQTDEFNNSGQGPQNGLLAVYVEATGDQVLRSLEMLESRKDLAGINLGPTLASERDMLSVVALDESPDSATTKDSREERPAAREPLAFLLEPSAERKPGPRRLRRSQADLTLADSADDQKIAAADADSIDIPEEEAAAGAAAASDKPAIPGKGIAGFTGEKSDAEKTTAADHQAELAYQIPARVRSLPPSMKGDAASKRVQASRKAKEQNGQSQPTSELQSVEPEQQATTIPAGQSRCRILFVISAADGVNADGAKHSDKRPAGKEKSVTKPTPASKAPPAETK